MKYFNLLFFILLTSCAHTPQNKSDQNLSVERLYQSPSLAGDHLRALKLSPDGTRATYLKAKKNDQFTFDLWEFNVNEQQHQLLVDSSELIDKKYQFSDEEKARRERLRIAGHQGILSYFWSQQSDALLFPINGDIYIYNLSQRQTQRITNTKAAETDVKFSPKGNYISYIRQQNLYVYDLKRKKEFSITRQGQGSIKYGMAEFMAQEEMLRRTGYWWAPNEKWIALTYVDERPVEKIKRYEIYANSTKMIEQRYPYTGKTNAIVKLAVAPLQKNPKLRWVPFQEEYLARVNWRPDSKVLTYQVQDRSQKILKLKSYSIKSKKQKILLQERSNTWVNLHKDLKFLKKSHQFVWSSERSGFRHLYLYDWSGRLIRPLTQGKWSVDQTLAYNSRQKKLFFTAAAPIPTQKNLFYVNLKNPTTATLKTLKPVNAQLGWSEISFSKNGELYLQSFSRPLKPPTFSLHQSNGKLVQTLVHNKITPQHPLFAYQNRLPRVDQKSFVSPQGTRLYYTLFTPHNFLASKKYPLLVMPYGGPTRQVSYDGWDRRDLWYSFLTQQGYVVIKLDNRGSPRRGKRFEDAIHKNMGSVEVEDQVAGVKHLIQQGFIDPSRVGMMGWSYGGYLSLMSFFKHPEIYSAAVAVAPVTDWKLYDTHYTERYMETPQNNPQGYKNSNVLQHIQKTESHLMVIHGMADDNVLFSHSTQLFSKLQKKAQPFSMMIYPGKKHGIAGKNARIHVFSTITEFFNEKLKQK